MGPITLEMVRRRSEHNDGVLETLEELVLQEEGIDKIEILGRLCPNLKILYMPNNLIPRLENIHRLKALEYLNLAINNITTLDGLDGCEMLNKLDLTLNFVGNEGLLTVSKLQANIHLKELFLSGNPCTDFPGYRKYVIATLSSLKHLDAHKIKPSERIKAQQDFRAIHATLMEVCSTSSDDNPMKRTEPLLNEKGEELHDYTAENRVKEHQEMQRLREEQENKGSNKSKQPKSTRRTGFDPLPTEGRIYQKNEANLDFKLLESECGKNVLCDVVVGRYLDISLIDVDVQPTWLRILVKGKLLQLHLPCEVKTEESFVQRSTTTGHLLVTMPKAVPDSKYFISALPHIKPKERQPSAVTKKQRELTDVVNIHNIVLDKPSTKPCVQPGPGSTEIEKDQTGTQNPSQKSDSNTPVEWEYEVPPLE